MRNVVTHPISKFQRVAYANPQSRSAVYIMAVGMMVPSNNDHIKPSAFLDKAFSDSYQKPGISGLERTPEPLHRDVTETTLRAVSQLRVERLARIQGVLGISTQDFAEILRMSRAGLYKWLDASKNIEIHEANLSRLNEIERLTSAWKKYSNAPLKPALREMLASGKTVYELLTAESIDKAATMDAFNEIAERLQTKPKSWARRMSDAGFTRRPVVRLSPDEV